MNHPLWKNSLEPQRGGDRSAAILAHLQAMDPGALDHVVRALHKEEPSSHNCLWAVARVPSHTEQARLARWIEILASGVGRQCLTKPLRLPAIYKKLIPPSQPTQHGRGPLDPYSILIQLNAVCAALRYFAVKGLAGDDDDLDDYLDERLNDPDETISRPQLYTIRLCLHHYYLETGSQKEANERAPILSQQRSTARPINNWLPREQTEHLRTTTDLEIGPLLMLLSGGVGLADAVRLKEPDLRFTRAGHPMVFLGEQRGWFALIIDGSLLGQLKVDMMEQGDHGFLFKNLRRQSGGPFHMTAEQAKQPLRRLAKSLGVAYASSTRLVAYGRAELLACGFSEPYVQGLAGHKRPQSILELKDQVKSAVSAQPRAFPTKKELQERLEQAYVKCMRCKTLHGSRLPQCPHCRSRDRTPPATHEKLYAEMYTMYLTLLSALGQTQDGQARFLLENVDSARIPQQVKNQ